MNDQRSTDDQLRDLAVHLGAIGMTLAAEWVRTRGAAEAPPPENRVLCARIANRRGLYDAAEWVRARA